FIFCISINGLAQKQMESLTRGVVAFSQGEGKVFISWRLFGTDPEDMGFNLYRMPGRAQQIKLNKQPIKESTHYVYEKVDIANNKIQQTTDKRIKQVCR